MSCLQPTSSQKLFFRFKGSLRAYLETHPKPLRRPQCGVQKNNHLYLQVNDSGPGIEITDWSENKTFEHLGLCGLHERVENLGGPFMLSANHSGIGVKITCCLPVN